MERLALLNTTGGVWSRHPPSITRHEYAWHAYALLHASCLLALPRRSDEVAGCAVSLIHRMFLRAPVFRDGAGAQ